MIRAFLIVILFFVGNSSAQVFKCSNSGRITYSTSPCLFGAVAYDNSLASVVQARPAIVYRGLDGGYTLAGTINSCAVNFAIDTGASSTTISGILAARLGIRRCVPAGITHTANGDTSVCRFVAEKLTIANFNFSNVSLVISPAMTMDALFGNDLLSQLSLNQKSGVITLSR